MESAPKLALFGFVRFADPLFSITWWLCSSKIDTLFFCGRCLLMAAKGARRSTGVLPVRFVATAPWLRGALLLRAFNS